MSAAVQRPPGSRRARYQRAAAVRKAVAVRWAAVVEAAAARAATGEMSRWREMIRWRRRGRQSAPASPPSKRRQAAGLHCVASLRVGMRVQVSTGERNTPHVNETLLLVQGCKAGRHA